VKVGDVNRLAIYVIYDKDGIIDDYIPFFLSALQPFVSHFVIVCNGKLNDEGRRKLSVFTEDVFVRPNEGYDGGAIKDVLFNLYGWEKVLSFDELLICNDTFFGPLYPLDECFKEMDSRDVDFWGMTLHKEYEVKSGYYNKTVPEHLQSYFLNVKKIILHSRHFLEFWNDYKAEDSLNTVIHNYEIAFTTVLKREGYRYSAYIDASTFLPSDPRSNYNYSVLDPMPTIKQLRCPIIKKKAFSVYDVYSLEHFGHDGSANILEFISDRGYDVNMIWDNILRTSNLHDLINGSYLYRTLDSVNTHATREDKSNALVILIQTDGQAYTNYDKYIAIANECADVITIQIEGDSNPAQMLRETVERIDEYEYICVVYECNSDDIRSNASVNYIRYENTMASRAYVENILHEFSCNPRLGYLAPPKPYHGKYFSQLDDNWTDEPHRLEDLCKAIGVTIPLSTGTPYISDGSAFWIRKEAVADYVTRMVKDNNLMKELENDPSYLFVLSMALPYIAQQNGYYSTVAISDSYSTVRLTDFENILSRLIYLERGRKEFNDFHSFFINDKSIDFDEIKSFRNSVKNVFIFGAGECADILSNQLEKHNISFDGFIVSDSHRKSLQYKGYPVLNISEAKERYPHAGVIPAIIRKYKREVIPVLEKAGFELYAAVVID